MEQKQRFQKLIPVGILTSQGRKYFLILPDPVKSKHTWVDNLGVYEFMVIPIDPARDSENHIIISGEMAVYPSPRPVVFTDFILEWGSSQDGVILAMPTRYEEPVEVSYALTEE